MSTYGEILLSARAALWANRRRAVLLAAIPAVGVAVISGAIGFVQTSAGELESSLRKLGADHVVVEPGGAGVGGEVPKLPAEAEERARRVPGVRGVAAMSRIASVKVSASLAGESLVTQSDAAPVWAAAAGLPSLLGTRMSGGRFINDFDETTAGPVAVVGSRLADQLGLLPGAQSLRLGGQVFGVVGVLAPVKMLPEMDRSVIVPASAAQRILSDDGRPSRLVVAVAHGKSRAVAGLLPTAVTYETAPAVAAEVASDLLAAREEINSTLAATVGGIGALTLLMSGVAIAASLSASVIQRRSEIGVRRALGHPRGVVSAQFLIEAVLLGASGACAGAIGGITAVLALTFSQGWSPVINPLTLLLASVLAIEVCGLGAIAPALKAARLDPLESLRS